MVLHAGSRNRAEIRFRPHHLLCTLCFRGEGYSSAFIEKYGMIAARLRDENDGDEVLIRLVEGPDEVCSFCPKLDNGLCETQEAVDELDRTHARVLGLQGDEILSWGEAKRLLAERMTLEAFEMACAPCGWKGRGICRRVLERRKEWRPEP